MQKPDCPKCNGRYYVTGGGNAKGRRRHVCNVCGHSGYTLNWVHEAEAPAIKVKPNNRPRSMAIAKDVAVVKSRPSSGPREQTSENVKIRNRVEDILLARQLEVPLDSLL